MSGADPTGALPSLASLRHDGAHRFDPAGFHYLEVLSQRVTAASGELRRILEGKQQAALSAHAERFSQARQAAGDELVKLSALRPDLVRELRRLQKAGDYSGLRRLGAQAAVSPARTPLAELNRHVQAATQPDPESGLGAGSELKSVQRFREVWSRIAAVDQVDQAMARGPENAGPLNSHTLVLRSLALMRGLSPDYLRRFVAQVDALLWLDLESQKSTPMEARPARRSRPKK